MSTRTITLRRDKSMPLTHDEMDDNLANLNADLAALESHSLPQAFGVGSYVLGILKNQGSHPVNTLVSGASIELYTMRLFDSTNSVLFSYPTTVLTGTWRNMGPKALQRLNGFKDLCLLMRIA